MIRFFSLFILTLPLLMTGCSSKSLPDNLPSRPTPAERVAVDYEPFAQASRGLLDYELWRVRPSTVTAEDQQLITDFLASIAWAEPKYFSEVEQQIFWVNASNAIALLEVSKGNHQVVATETPYFIAGEYRTAKLIQSENLEEVNGVYFSLLTGTGESSPIPYDIPTPYNYKEVFDEMMKKRSTANQ